MCVGAVAIPLATFACPGDCRLAPTQAATGRIVLVLLLCPWLLVRVLVVPFVLVLPLPALLPTTPCSQRGSWQETL